MSSDDNKPEGVAGMLRSVLIGCKDGISLHKIQHEYMQLTGKTIPFRDFGFQTIEQYIRSIPKFATLNRHLGDTVVQAVVDDADSHIQSLVQRQKSSKKNRVSLRGQRRLSSTLPRRPSSWQQPYRSNQNHHYQNHYQHQHQPSMSSYYQHRRSPPLPPPAQRLPQQIKSVIHVVSQREPIKTNKQVESGGSNSTSQKLKFHSSYEIPPRHQNKQRMQTPANNNISLATVPNHQDTNSKKQKSNKDTMEEYANKNGVQLVFQSLRIQGKKQLYYICTLKFNARSYNSYPKELATSQEAEEEAAKNAVLALGLTELKSENEEAEFRLVDRIEEILASLTNGVWSDEVPGLYQKKYKEVLHEDWLTTIIINTKNPKIQFQHISGRMHLKLESGDESTSHTVTAITNNMNDEIVNTPVDVETYSSSHTRDNNGVFEASSLPRLLLPQDSSWDVYVTYVTSSTDVAIRLVGEEYSEKYEVLSTEMDNYYSNQDTSTPMLEVKCSRVYAANMYDSWHRVEVLSVSENKVNCMFLDHGDMDEVDLPHMRELAEPFRQLAPQAIHCKLHNLETYAQNAAALVYLIEKLVGKTLVAEVISSHDIPSLVLYDTSSDEDVNVTEECLEFVKNQIIVTKLPDVGNIAEVYLTHVSVSSEIFLQPHGECFNVMVGLLTEAKGRCEIKDAITEVCKEKMYLAKYAADGNWYRAVALDPSLVNDTVKVLYVDYGNHESIALSEIRDAELISEGLLGLPHQAIKCRLHSVPPTSNLEWTDAVTKKLVEMAPVEQELLVKVIIPATSDKVAEVELFKRLQPTKDLVSINIILGEDMSLFRRKSNVATKLDGEQIPVTTSLPQLHYIPCVHKLDDPTNAGVGTYFDVFINMAESPDKFTVQPWCQGKSLDQLVIDMKIFYTDMCQPLNKSNIDVGKLFAHRSRVHNMWYRAQVRNIHDNTVSIYYVDFGDLIESSYEDLQPLFQEFTKLSYQAISCKLAGVSPVNGCWTFDDCAYFCNYVMEKPFVAKVMTKNRDSNNLLCMSIILICTSDPAQDLYLHLLLIQEKRAKKS